MEKDCPLKNWQTYYNINIMAKQKKKRFTGTKKQKVITVEYIVQDCPIMGKTIITHYL